MAYQYPPKFEPSMTLKERLEIEDVDYEPVRHENTGVDEEEALYESYLVSVEVAVERLGRSVQSDVVKKGWEMIQSRRRMEEKS